MAEWVYIQLFLNFSTFPACKCCLGGGWAGGVTFQECFGAFGCEIASAAEEAGGGMDETSLLGKEFNPGQSSIFWSFLHYLERCDITWPSYWQHLNSPLKWDHPAFDHEFSGRWLRVFLWKRCHVTVSHLILFKLKYYTQAGMHMAYVNICTVYKL